eukprot:9897332-Lingulodinium_polyedra.AAC.1
MVFSKRCQRIVDVDACRGRVRPSPRDCDQAEVATGTPQLCRTPTAQRVGPVPKLDEAGIADGL